METYKIIVLGASGSGKTVYLASLFHKLTIQQENIGFFLDVPAAQRKELVRRFQEVSDSENWPRATQLQRVSEWNFTCRVKSDKFQIFPALEFTYLDYAGEILTEPSSGQESSTVVDQQARAADALLGLIDGQKIYSAMTGRRGLGSLFADLDNIIALMMNNINPVHFVITKWDIFQQSDDKIFANCTSENAILQRIREFLFEYDNFREFVNGRLKQSPVRLIPISSVGKGFAQLQVDGKMKKNGTQPKPYQVEIPLACVLPDKLEMHLRVLVERQRQLEKLATNVTPQYTIWEGLRKLVGGTLNAVRNELPLKFQFAEPVFRRLVDYTLSAPLQKERDATLQTEKLNQDKIESLRLVTDEYTAANHAVRSFLYLAEKLRRDFPASDLSTRN